jgi:hypothetical protein
MAKRLIPDGSCWCGCGDEPALGSFFRPGHDKFAESAVIEIEYGTVVDFIDHHGFGPGKKSARRELARYRDPTDETLS